MADNSKIEWTDASWNPIRARNVKTGMVGWFCTHASEGCRNCYAETINHRLGTGVDYLPQALKAGEVEVFLDEAMLTQPLRWKRGRRIFVGSMTDLFADFVTDSMLDRVFAVMATAPQHTFQLLTKRPARMRDYIEGQARRPRFLRLNPHELAWSPYEGGVPRNIWLGVSVEDQANADARIPDLLATPAAVRFLSAEPLLGPIDLTKLAFPSSWERCDCPDQKPTLNALDASVYCEGCCEGAERLTCGALDQVIVGGESGPKARPMHPDWARQIRDHCADQEVAFFFKQWGEWREVLHDLGETIQVDADSDDAMAVLDGVKKPSWITQGGVVYTSLAALPDDDTPCRLVERLGKRAAGRLLDGVEHSARPDVDR